MNKSITPTATSACSDDINILSNRPLPSKKTCNEGTNAIKNAATANIMSHITVRKMIMLKSLKQGMENDSLNKDYSFQLIKSIHLGSLYQTNIVPGRCTTDYRHFVFMETTYWHYQASLDTGYGCV
jgi:hypothetical protein